MLSDLTPIPTFFNGRMYRSRAEARWAVFFDALRMKIVYEWEGYKLGCGRILYLPDFLHWPAQGQCFIEIKPDGIELDINAERKAQLLADESRLPVFVFGDMKHPQYEGATGGSGFFPFKGKDYPYIWTQCADCGSVYPCFNGRADDLPCNHYKDNRSYGWSTIPIIKAMEVAINYEFTKGRQI